MLNPAALALLTSFAARPALAQSAVVERPLLPALSLAGEDGAASIWQNPANLAFDPDAGYALLYRKELLQDAPAGFALAGNTGALGTGLQYTTGPDGTPWWTLSSGLGLRLDRNLAIGVDLGWQLPSGPDNNLLTWDFSASYRPLPWLGVAAAIQNIGDPAPDEGIDQRYGAGLALRPWDGRALLGVDYMMTGKDGSIPGGVLSGSLRVTPVRGLAVRAYGDSAGTVGGGLEVNIGGPRLGLHATAPLDGGTTSAVAYLMSGSEDERLFGGRDTVADFVVDDDYPYQPSDSFFNQKESYLHLLGRIEQAAEDDHLRGIVLHLNETPFSVAQIEELRHAVQRARAAGHPVVAYLDRASSNGAYLLATAADKVYLHPAGQLDLIGLSAEVQLYGGTLAMVGVKPQFAKRAEYKSAVESYTNTESSGPAREQMDALLDDLYAVLVDGIAEGRNKKPDDVRALVDRGPFTADEALKEGLIDGVMYPDELEKALGNSFKDGYDLDEEYGETVDESGWRSPYEIAVIYVDGTIVSGESAGPGLLGGGYSAGSDTIVSQLEQALHERNVKAVILRVDSPGGSAFASDEIWRAVERVKREKPVVVSMGGVAASGGYYVSSGATKILAEPATITGSIGVFGGKISLEGLYDKLGVHYELYDRGRNAALYSSSKPMDDEEFAALDRMVGDTYRLFKERVTSGRHMDPDKVEQVARGRVWSGTDALAVGLVDQLGGFDDAVKVARELSDIPDKASPELITYDGRFGEARMLRDSVQSLVEVLPQAWLPAAAAPLPVELRLLDQYRLLSQDTVWALLPYQIQVR